MDGRVVSGAEPAKRSADNPARPSRRGRASEQERFRPSRESEARLLLLIDAFSRKADGSERYLEGRVKLAKLDFLIRYPRHLRQLLLAHGAQPKQLDQIDPTEAPMDSKMIRYRYGPWDPSYYAILGSLIGRGLVQIGPLGSSSGYGYRTSEAGARLAATLRADESFSNLDARLILARRYLDKAGSTLKSYLYEIPEIADANWEQDL
jgi:hypothetical protein